MKCGAQYSTSSDTDGFEGLDSCYVEPDGFLLPIFDSKDEQLPTSETPEVPENPQPNDQYSHTIPSDTDVFDCTEYYFEDDGPVFPIIDGGDEQLDTSETTEVPTSSEFDGSEDNDNVVRGSLQKEEGETIFSRAQTSLSALSSFIMVPVESVSRGVTYVTGQILNIGRAPFTSPTSETELPPTSETAEVPTPSVSLNTDEKEQSPTSKQFVDSSDRYDTPDWTFLFEPENTTRAQRLHLIPESEERNEQSPL